MSDMASFCFPQMRPPSRLRSPTCSADGYAGRKPRVGASSVPGSGRGGRRASRERQKRYVPQDGLFGDVSALRGAVRVGGSGAGAGVPGGQEQRRVRRVPARGARGGPPLRPGVRRLRGGAGGGRGVRRHGGGGGGGGGGQGGGTGRGWRRRKREGQGVRCWRGNRVCLAEGTKSIKGLVTGGAICERVGPHSGKGKYLT
ncbi:hypothetical protein VTK73DRAFT_2912 [Phialemonium thermophilum]|uniref:Uncharacterized protein n=1 Tax=Phialemonium thermophilum TaxID=223376 RepID=A0ABR3VMU7_9PEZI